jgi:hypothetical protein
LTATVAGWLCGVDFSWSPLGACKIPHKLRWIMNLDLTLLTSLNALVADKGAHSALTGEPRRKRDVLAFSRLEQTKLETDRRPPKGRLGVP